MSNIDKQALREAAEKAQAARARLESIPDEDVVLFEENDIKSDVSVCNKFIVTANPTTVLALLDELEHYKSREERVTKLVLDNSTSWDVLYEKLEAAEKRIAEQREYYEGVIADGSKRIAELERANAAQDDHINQQQVRIDALEETNHELGKAARVNSYWKPDVCPVTGRQFFMWIEHETLGYVPTYGGPFDSYTIPTRDSSGEFSCERYDHDFGGWVGGEFIGLYLIDDDEQCRVCELEERIAELEARTVVVKQFDDFQIVHYGATEDYAKGYIDCQSNYNKAIYAAGIKVKGEYMATLTKQEKAWVKKLNKLLAECPSNRIAFATTGDCEVSLFDVTRYDEIFDEVEKGKSEFIPSAMRIGATFNECLTFPNQVESTAG